MQPGSTKQGKAYFSLSVLKGLLGYRVALRKGQGMGRWAFRSVTVIRFGRSVVVDVWTIAGAGF